MAQGPENTFIRAVNKHVRAYFEKNHNQFRSGTPDVFYSGDKGALWVEYKYIPRIPTRTDVVPDLSPRQKLWLRNRHKEGRHVAVIVGSPNGGVVYQDLDWEGGITAVVFQERLLTRAEVARWIEAQVGYAAVEQLPPLPDLDRDGTFV